MPGRGQPAFCRDVIIGLICLSAVTASSLAAKEAEQQDPDTELANLLAMRVPELQRRYNVPGVAIALWQDGKEPVVFNFGVTDARTKAPITDDTTFQVASISKLVTGALVLQLRDAGEISLDEPIGFYLHSFALPPSQWTERDVTIRRILNHTAGLSVHGYFPGSVIPGEMPTLQQSLEGNLNDAEKVELVAEPGRGYRYSGGGFSLLQLALEEKYNAPFARLAEDRLFKPLGLSAASFEADAILDGAGAQPHDSAGKAMPQRAFANVAAGGLVINAGELAMLAEAVLGKGPLHGKLLTNEGQFLLTSPSAIGEATSRGVTMEQAMVAPGSAPGPYLIRPTLGAMIATRGDGSHVIGHTGSNVGWKAAVEYVPETGAGIAVLTNSETGNGILLPVVCEWLKVQDRARGVSADRHCPEFGLALLEAAYARDGVDGMQSAYSKMHNASPGAYLFDDWTAVGFVISLFAQRDLGLLDMADILAAGQVVLRDNAVGFPQSGLAASANSLILALAGKGDEACREASRAMSTGPLEEQASGLLGQATSILGANCSALEKAFATEKAETADSAGGK